MDVMPGGIWRVELRIYRTPPIPVIHCYCGSLLHKQSAAFRANCWRCSDEFISCSWVYTSTLTAPSFWTGRLQRASLCMFRRISPSSMPIRTLPIPNLGPSVSPHPHMRPAVCIHDAPTPQTCGEDYERVKFAECISITPITIAFTPTSQLSK